jgi:hypothetical protein
MGMLHRLQRHILQITPTSVAFKGLTRTDLSQMEQVVIRAETVGASCVAII